MFNVIWFSHVIEAIWLRDWLDKNCYLWYSQWTWSIFFLIWAGTRSMIFLNTWTFKWKSCVRELTSSPGFTMPHQNQCHKLCSFFFFDLCFLEFKVFWFVSIIFWMDLGIGFCNNLAMLFCFLIKPTLFLVLYIENHEDIKHNCEYCYWDMYIFS